MAQNLGSQLLVTSRFPLDSKTAVGVGADHLNIGSLLGAGNVFREYLYHGLRVTDIGTGRLYKVRTDNTGYLSEFADNQKVWVGASFGTGVDQIPPPNSAWNGNSIYDGDIAITHTGLFYLCKNNQWEASAFLSIPSLIQATSHNTLAGLQGGSSSGSGERFHLTSAQHTIATQPASASVAGYVVTGTQSFSGNKTFTGNVIAQGTLTLNSGGNTYTFPTVRGTSGYLLQTDGAGATSWVQAPSTGIQSINSQTGSAQTIAIGTTAQSNNIGIVSSANTHTIHIPDASSVDRGVITTGAQTIAGAKTFNDNLKTAGTFLSIGRTFLSTDNGGAYVAGGLDVGAYSGSPGEGGDNFSSKFNVVGSSGNTSISGTLAVTGAATLNSTLAVTGASTFTGNAKFEGQAYSEQHTQTSLVANTTINMNNANVFFLTIGGNIEISAQNMIEGATYIIVLKALTQNRDVTFNSTNFPGIGTVTLEFGVDKYYSWTGVCIKDGSDYKLLGVVDLASKNLLV